jgi:protein-tyrosine phosphatase
MPPRSSPRRRVLRISRCPELIDLHSHILPGVDDGARDLAESVAIAEAAVADGVKVMAATPHVRADYPTRSDTMNRLVAEVRAALARAGVPLDVQPGGELALDSLARMSLADASRFGLAGNPSYLLLEFPYYGWPLEIETVVLWLRRGGVTAVVAHPERNGDVQANPDCLRPLVHAGALVQITASSLDGSLGRSSRSTAVRLLELELAHLVASDAHGPSARPAQMSQALATIGDPALGAWLTRDLPGAIVAGRTLPMRPKGRSRRRFSLRRH